ncbi:MAG: hypothetical protein IJU21_06000, partial [Bacteroidales bacterium]|nr:hypothetical protein [Bacteroidales bacterium]
MKTLKNLAFILALATPLFVFSCTKPAQPAADENQEQPADNQMPFTPDGTWTVVGSMNEWNATAGYEMIVEGDARIAKGIHLNIKDEFKFVMNGSWETNLGAGAPNTKFTAEQGEEFALQADGGN